MRIVVNEFISLDGVVQAPGGAQEDTDGGFQHGGWSMPFFDPEVMGGSFDEMTQRTDALLYGRRTWRVMADAWPGRAGDPFADWINQAQKYVVSSTLTEPTWRNSKVVGGYDAAILRSLKDEVDGDLYVSGSGTLVRAMLADGLIDGLHLFVFPLTRGEGPRLFPPEASPGKLELERTETYPNGVVYLTYRPA